LLPGVSCQSGKANIEIILSR